MKLLKVHKTFATGESTVDFRQLAKFQRMYWRNFRGCIGEISEDVLAKFQRMYWRKYSGLSLMANVLLAKVLIGEIPEPPYYIIQITNCKIYAFRIRLWRFSTEEKL